MQLRALTVENFRGYRESTTVSVGDFTAIIGRNDVGKSTLLEALEIFFNGGKPDSDDAHIDRRGKITRISCQFDELPSEVVIDAKVRTSLAAEHLLNRSGMLEIVKEYQLDVARIAPRVFARALHPTADGGQDLLQLKNNQLKSRAVELGVNWGGVDQRVNTSIRRAIWASLNDLALQERLIDLNSEDGKRVWTRLQEEMPAFALFQADRRSRDDDSEVTDPFEVAIKDAVSGLEAKFEEIRREVQKRVEGVAARTLQKLREMDKSLADQLHTDFRAEPRWSGFKLSLKDHRGIPINKRGSGVRRLILLNFFRAEAERRQQETNAAGMIYAIEEPESSQHPSSQRLLVDALLELCSGEQTQVVVTTHVPGVAALVPPESVRYIRHDANRHPYLSEVGEETLRLVADELGVLPDNRVKLLLYVEGPNDVAFLEHASRLVGSIELSTDPRVAFVVTGGGNLKHWVNHQYLKSLGLPEIHIYDRDNDCKYQDQVELVNQRPNGDWATLTTKREIENYVHPDAVRTVLGIEVEIDDDADVPLLTARALHEASESLKTWDEVEKDKRNRKSSQAKRRLCQEVIAQMSRDQLRDRDPSGEVEVWFQRIREKLDGHPSR